MSATLLILNTYEFSLSEVKKISRQIRNYENCDATSQRVWLHFEVIEAHIAELRVKRTQDTAKKYSQDGN